MKLRPQFGKKTTDLQKLDVAEKKMIFFFSGLNKKNCTWCNMKIQKSNFTVQIISKLTFSNRQLIARWTRGDGRFFLMSKPPVQQLPGRGVLHHHHHHHHPQLSQGSGGSSQLWICLQLKMFPQVVVNFLWTFSRGWCRNVTFDEVTEIECYQEVQHL